jgi:UDP-N-acetyl-2-amino-2-deoxyglucuronate dehydrogenase
MSSGRERAPVFGLVGAAGYIAPRHMAAMRDVGGTLAVACDPSDSVGILDRYTPEAAFFTEFERFEAAMAARSRRGLARVSHVAVCSPNHLHPAHAAAAMRLGADVVCEKPLVIAPDLLDELAEIEAETGRRVFNILQLRHHAAILDLKTRLTAAAHDRKHEVTLTYVTSRGPWYDASWKSDPQRSGGIAMNIGIHFFDMLAFVFGDLQENRPHRVEPRRASGFLEFERARVRWFLSIDRADLPADVAPGQTTWRSITVDGAEVEFSGGFTDLHTESYREILAGRGWGIEAARTSIEASHRVHHGPCRSPGNEGHPMLRGATRDG